jgi:hypothetical protein
MRKGIFRKADSGFSPENARLAELDHFRVVGRPAQLENGPGVLVP